MQIPVANHFSLTKELGERRKEASKDSRSKECALYLWMSWGQHQTILTTWFTFLLPRYGVCEPYAGLAGPCNSLFRAGVDYIYIPYTRTHGDQHRLSQHMNDTQLSITFIPERCRDVTIKLLCNFYLIPCGNSTVFLPPVSVCSEQCFHLRNDLCPDEWELVLGYLNANQWLVDIGLGFIDCNNAGLMLEPLPYCCTDAGVTLRKWCCKYGTLHNNKGCLL